MAPRTTLRWAKERGCGDAPLYVALRHDTAIKQDVVLANISQHAPGEWRIWMPAARKWLGAEHRTLRAAKRAVEEAYQPPRPARRRRVAGAK